MKDYVIPKRGFTPSEFEIRVERAQRIMRRNELDAVFVTTPPNVRYFTGFDSQFWESPTRPWFVVVPLSGEPARNCAYLGEGHPHMACARAGRRWRVASEGDAGRPAAQV
ncbi:MAG: aminopeptidase P family N-terminal domain-containing protein [Rhizobiales bacterium]|nr:aminopeptidase P family N-terminal domain-containing protein [Hyphomicrobiales bacterium]